MAPFASGVDSRIKKGTDSSAAAAAAAGGFGNGGGGSGGGGVISEGVESKRPGLMIGQGDNETNHTGPMDGRHEEMAAQGSSRHG